ncbi:hypothetical protein ACFYPC_20270 [Streptomyces sp. NPDC005808]|uniref:hypothetical protein n=1 Tax=Streptomyces sp. NPDC005808 TaxID=3364734 RepID=UPI00368A0667
MSTLSLVELFRELQGILTFDLGAPTTAEAALFCFCGTRAELPGELASQGSGRSSAAL